MTTPFPQQPPVPQGYQPVPPQAYPYPMPQPVAQPAKSKERKTYAAVLGVVGIAVAVVGTVAMKGNEGDVVKLIGFAIGAVASLLWSSAKKLEKEEQAAAQPPMPYSYPQGYTPPAQFAGQPPAYPYPMVQPTPRQGYVYPSQGVPANPQQTVQPSVADQNGEVK